MAELATDISTAGTLSDLDALLDGLELEQVALAGHSLAAHMVALYAATRSERVRALVLLNAAPPFAPEHKEEFGQRNDLAANAGRRR